MREASNAHLTSWLLTVARGRRRSRVGIVIIILSLSTQQGFIMRTRAGALYLNIKSPSTTQLIIVTCVIRECEHKRRVC